MAISFRPMTRDDLPLVHEWHQRPHVVRWWTVRKTFEETEAHYLPTIEGTDPTQHYLALLDGEPLGMIQTYLVSDYPDYAALIEEGEGTAGLDLFIGDEAQTGTRPRHRDDQHLRRRDRLRATGDDRLRS